MAIAKIMHLTILEIYLIIIIIRLTLKSALADISAVTNTRKQSAVTFEVFVLRLRNQRYYTCDVIGIQTTYRDLPYYKGISPKHAMNIKQPQKSRKLFTYL